MNTTHPLWEQIDATTPRELPTLCRTAIAEFQGAPDPNMQASLANWLFATHSFDGLAGLNDIFPFTQADWIKETILQLITELEERLTGTHVHAS